MKTLAAPPPLLRLPLFCSVCMDENEVATSIRKSLTQEWQDCTWQVLVGRNFGSYVSFEESRYIYFYIAQVRATSWQRQAAGASCAIFPQPTHACVRSLLPRRLGS